MALLWGLPWGRGGGITLVEKKHGTQRVYADVDTATQLVSGDVRGGALLSLAYSLNVHLPYSPQREGWGQLRLDLTLLPGLI